MFHPYHTMNLSARILRSLAGSPALTVMVLLALGVRLAIAPLGAHPGDAPVLARWAEALRAYGWLNVYLASDANYPPLGMALIGLARALAGLLAPGAPIGGPVWLVCLKLPAVLADALVMALVSHESPAGRRASPWLLLSLALNPALLHLSAWWGQLDSVYAALALAALAAAARDRPLWAGAALAAAVLVKLQGAAIAPLALLAVVLGGPRRSGKLDAGRASGRLLRLVLGSLLALSVGLLPFVIAGQGSLLAQRLIAVIAAPNWLTINALNVWYLVTGGAGNWTFNAPLAYPDSTLVLWGIPARTMGAVLLTAWTALVVWRAWRSMRSGWAGKLYLAGALLYLGIFLWPTQSHERYALAAIPLLAAAAAATRPANGERSPGEEMNFPPRLIWNVYIFYAIITVTVMLNLLWAAAPFAWLEAWAGDRAAGWGIAALLMLSAGWGMALLWRGSNDG